MVARWFQAFVVTALVEVPVVLWLTRGSGPMHRRLTIALFGQLATHPLVWFVFPFIPRLTGFEALALSELWALAAEAWLYAVALGLRPAAALGASGVANGLSFALGLLLAGRGPR